MHADLRKPKMSRPSCCRCMGSAGITLSLSKLRAECSLRPIVRWVAVILDRCSSRDHSDDRAQLQTFSIRSSLALYGRPCLCII